MTRLAGVKTMLLLGVGLGACGNGSGGDDDGASFASAQWEIVDVAGNIVPCPADTPNVGMMTDDVGAFNAPPADPFSGGASLQIVPCSDGHIVAQALAPDMYDGWVELLTSAAVPVAKSLPQHYAIDDPPTSSGYDFDAHLVVDGGYFEVAWTLNMQTSCDAAATADGVAMIAVAITSTAGGAPHTDTFACAAGAARHVFTALFGNGDYDVTVSALGSASQPIGTPVDLGTKTMAVPPGIVDLGTVDLATH